mgnify:CR=1 FL=1
MTKSSTKYLVSLWCCARSSSYVAVLTVYWWPDVGLIMSLMENLVSYSATLMIISLVLHTFSPIRVTYSVMVRVFTVRVFIVAFVAVTITCLPKLLTFTTLVTHFCDNDMASVVMSQLS